MAPVTASTQRMELYGTSHVVMLVLTVVLSVVLVWAVRRIRGRLAEKTATRTAGWVLLLITVVWTARGMLPANWHDESLPFHLSDALRVVTAVALIWRVRWAIAICYFWGLTLNLQSLLTPNLHYLNIPALEFTLYWVLHIAVFLTPVVFIGALDHRPRWRDFGFAYAAMLVWAGLASVANVVIGANYMFLSEKPPGPSVLDLLGPWPIYIIWEAVLIAAVWALMTWPWTRGRRRRSQA